MTEWHSDLVTKWLSDRVTKWPSDQVTGSFADNWPYGIFTVYTFRANMCHTASRLLSSGIKVSRTITSDPIFLIKTITITANFQTQSFAAPQPQPDHHLYSNSVTFPPLAARCGHNIAATDKHQALFCGARPWHSPLHGQPLSPAVTIFTGLVPGVSSISLRSRWI